LIGSDVGSLVGFDDFFGVHVGESVRVNVGWIDGENVLVGATVGIGD